MVNSGSFDSDGQGDRNAKAGLTQPHSASDSTQSSSPVTASAATSCNSGFSQTADSGLPSVAHAIEPTPTKTEYNCNVENFTNLSSVDGAAEEKTSLCCSLPLEKIQGVLTSYRHPPPAKADEEGAKAAKLPTRKLLCLYCDRSFVSSNLRQKHVERIHSARQNRRISSRRQNQLTVTPCVYCDRLNGTENTLKDLFQHLINEHSSKYFGCLPCEDRFLTSSLLADHNAVSHSRIASASPEKTTLKSIPSVDEEIPMKITRSRMRPKPEEDEKIKKPVAGNKKKSTKLKELRSKKLSVKSSRIALKRRESKRLQAIAKLTDTQKKKRPRPVEKKTSNSGRTEQTNSTKSTEKLKTLTCINPYPEFDNFYRVKKITDHSIDNLKISSLTFDDVFDKAFFNRIRCNIEENLLHHIDGKLFKNEESESRISNFEKVSNVPQEIQNANSENFGCELSLNAVTPVASLSLNSQFGEDFESQIEYGSKPSKKKTQPRKDEIHYKYFTRRKYQASILEHKENRDLSKLDMWTQLVIKKRQQKMLDDKKTAKEILEYTSCDEYKNKLKREELNRILDRRGPFEDLKEEASKKAALDKLNSASHENISEETFTQVREVLNEILNRVFATTEEISFAVATTTERTVLYSKKEDLREIPAYLNLRRSSSLPSDGEIDKSDKIALICSSQETENFELPTNQVRGKNELIELTGEWARCRMFICAACGAKLPNMRYLLDHKSLYHQNVWVQHYEFVGNQSELYRHLSIPALGKVGAVEDSVQCKVWRRSDARLCTKCGKQCNSLGELHRHILECGGDWTWMLARKKCKYRPFGAKSRRKRRGLIHRVHNKQKTEPTEKKTYKKTFEGPRQRPSDADTIQRMLANLPAKRSTRKLISLHDGIYRARKTTQNIKQNKVKCGKVIYKSSSRKETTEKTVNAVPTLSKSQINSSSSRRSLRNLNKVLVSRILDTNTTLNVKRKIKALNERRRTRKSLLEQENSKEIINDENLEHTLPTDSSSPSKPKSKVVKKDDVEPEEIQPANKRSSPRSSPKNLKQKMSVKKLLTGKINIKSFFPVKKKKNRKILTENQNPQEVENVELENSDVKTRSKRKLKEPCEEKTEEKKNEVATVKTEVKTEQKKTKHETFSTLVRSFSLRKKKLAKKSVQNKTMDMSLNNVNVNPNNPAIEKSEENIQVFLQNDQELDVAVKKRKLKSSFRNVINKVKKLKIDNAPEKTAKAENLKLNQKNHTESAFLEESNLEGPSPPVQVEKVVTPSTSETKENTDISTTVPTVINFHDNNENPPIPETIFKLELNNEKSLQAKGELDFDTQPLNTNVNKSSDSSIEENTKTETSCKESNTAIDKTDKIEPISIETSVKPKIVPLISPNMKGKIRKPARGLNDCIAMLTSKLQQKTVEEKCNKVDSSPNLLSPNKALVPFRESYAPKTECILRIPTYRSQLMYPEIEETALDLSTKSLKNKDLPEKEEPFQKSLDTYNYTTIVKLNDEPNKNFVVPNFDRNINKVFNSIDRIIEEVVENRFQYIVPQIQQRQWNSVDDIIQKVIDDQRSELKLPIRNSVDDIIDFVIESSGSTDNKINKVETRINEDVIINKEITIRKIGSIRKPKNKKSLAETVSDARGDAVSRVTATEEKEPLGYIAVNKLDHITDIGCPSNAITIAKNRSLKNSKSQKVDNNLQHTASKDISHTPTVPSVAKISNVSEFTVDKNKTEDEVISSLKENYLQSLKLVTNVDSPEKIHLHLNDAFIDDKIQTVEKRSTAKAKKGNRKVGQIRNRSRVKKMAEINTVEPEKKFIETNIDVLLDIKEIKSNSVLQYSTNLYISNESLLTKCEEMKHLSNEDEPHLLENKSMALQQKFNSIASDSEDDIPLAALVKSDENSANPIEQKSKNNSSNETSCDDTTIEQQNQSVEKNKNESKDDKDLQIQESEKDNGIKETTVSIVEGNSIQKRTFINNTTDIKKEDINKLKIEEIKGKLNDEPNVTKKQTTDTNLCSVTEILESKQTKVLISNSNSLDKPQDEDIPFEKKEVGRSLNFKPVEAKNTIRKSKSLKQDNLTSASSECEKNGMDLPEECLSDTKRSSNIKPKKKGTNELDGNNSKLICLLQNANEKSSFNTKKSKRVNTQTKLDIPNEPLEILLDSKVNSETKAEELTIQLKPLLTTSDDCPGTVINFKRKSELSNNLLDNISSEDAIEGHKMELKPILDQQSDEFSPKTKAKPVKSKAKSNTVKTQVHDSLKFPKDTPSNTVVVYREQTVEPKPIEETDKKLNAERTQNLLIEDEIPLKHLYQNVHNRTTVSNKTSRGSEEVDREIESILFSRVEVKSNTRANSSKRKNVKHHMETNIKDNTEANNSISHETTHTEHSEQNKEKNNSNKCKEKPSKSKEIKNVNNITDTVINTNKQNTEDKMNVVCKAKDTNDIFLNDVLLLHSELDVETEKTLKEPKQPMMKNFEISVELTDITKSVFSLSNNKNGVLNEVKKGTEFKMAFVEPEINIKNKRQSKSINKQPTTISNNSFIRKSVEIDTKINYMIEEQAECISNFEFDKLNRSKSKYKSSSNIIPSPDQSNTNVQLENKNFTGTLEESSVNKRNNILENGAPDLEQPDDTSSQLNAKRKVKRNRHSTKTKKTKSKGFKVSQINKNQIDLKPLEKNISQETPIITVIDLLVDNTNVAPISKEINKTISPLIDPYVKQNTIENIPNKVDEAPPIKIIINKQKTRRKSKSFKKIDLKGQNDLFEDFALVIKKPKRVTPIIAFTPVDTFSKDIYPNYLKKPIEESFLLSKIDAENEEADETHLELDSSVEEMDMELDEIPITSNIIERDTKSFLPSVADVFTKTDVDTFVETLNELENNKQNNEEETTRVKNSIKDIPIEELFLSSEKDLALPTEAEVEEFLYETDRSIENKNIDKQDLNKTCNIDSGNKPMILDDSYENVQDLTKLDFISEDMNDKESIDQTLPTQEIDGDKANNDIFKALTIQCKELVEKLGSKKATGKKKKCRNSKNLKVKSLPTSTGPENINAELVLSSPVLDIDIGKDNKRKRSKSTTVAEIDPTEKLERFDCSLNDLGKESNKLKDIDSIYAFSESEDFEIEKPIEKPKRPPRKQTKSLSESVNTPHDNSVVDDMLLPICDTTFTQSQNDLKPDTECKEVITKSSPAKRKLRLCNSSPEKKIIGEIKENDITIQEEGRKSIRSAKVKALEHIHDDALAELTESERNRDIENDKNGTIDTDAEELNKKKVSRRQSRSQKSQIIDDLKLPSDSTMTTNSDQVSECQQNQNNSNDNIDELVKENTKKSDDNEPLEQESNLNEVMDNSKQPTEKKSNKKTKANKPKSKKSLDTFQIPTENTEKSLLLNNIAGDLTGLEELENSIEKELKADSEAAMVSKQSKNKSKQEPFEAKINEPVLEENKNTDLPTEDNNQELRRSRRGSRKIASYNENDLIDPLLDEIDGKKKIRKKEKAVIEELENKSQRKPKEPEKKMNSEELFDLLKASSNEKNCDQKSQNMLLSNTNGLNRDFNVHTFQNAFENILDGADKSKDGKNVESIYEFTDSPENIEQPKNSTLSLDVPKRQTRKLPRSAQLKSHTVENSDLIPSNVPNSENRLISSAPDILELSMESKTKSLKSDKTESSDKSSYCEICNKKFMRTESLGKHKRTLTHIQKLSEIEAKEAAQKSQSEELANNSSKTSNSIIEITSDSSKVTDNLSKTDINIHDILHESDKPNRQDPPTDHPTFPHNHSLKLADIINDVLNKPVLEDEMDKHNSFSDIIMQNNADIQPECRRYKSLGERKSFDSEPIESRPVPISEPYVSKTTILEKQISLLENIIENQTGINYIDDISMSSNNSLENNPLISPSELSLRQDDSNTYSRINTKPNTNDDSFLKPSQYEEISEDSVNLRSYEDQKLRKTLNRDEELFLECCSLLKSGSEMSSYSNKKSQNKILNTMGLKQCDEPEWLERKNLVEKPLYDIVNEYSDNSRIPTPLGDSYDDDASNSNTISSNWNMNKEVNVFEDISQDKEDDGNKSFSFQEILNEDEEQDINKGNVSKFGVILSKTIGDIPKVMKRTAADNYMEKSSGKKQEELNDGLTSDCKKIITKGARKVFEGLKVSIPTEELNLEEVLNCSPKSKKLDIVNIQNSTEKSEEQSLLAKPTRTARKSKPVKNKSQFGSNLLFKMKKNKVTSPGGTKNKNSEVKTHDIYDFEETQDNTDVFTKPDFRAFRNMSNKSNEAIAEPESDADSRDYMDSFSYEAQSITSSISSSSSKKPKTEENITKKKCMIMGRIFKNAAKSKIEDIDEEIRDIPALDNCELVENYVADCKKIIKNEEVVKPKLSEKEINQLFDQLLEDRLSGQDAKNTEIKSHVKPKTDVVKKTDNKKKPKPKNKKRTRTNSESTDDEFSLNKTIKKRAYRKNAKAEDNCINLEQELKECIGVASRKSQRKCTSGKQNVLVEYWSSDDSQFEALLESQRIEVKQPTKIVEVNEIVEPELVSQESEVIVETPKPLCLNALEKLKPKSMEKKPQQKRKPSSEKRPKSTGPGSEKTSDSVVSNRRKRAAVNPLYHWSSSSEDESHDLIEVKPLRDELEDDEDRPVQHGWIVGDSPKKLVTMLAQAKGKKTDIDCVKEQGKKRTNGVS